MLLYEEVRSSREVCEGAAGHARGQLGRLRWFGYVQCTDSGYVMERRKNTGNICGCSEEDLPGELMFQMLGAG